MRNLIAALAVCAALLGKAGAEPIALDEFAGRWAIVDASGAEIGESLIEIQAPGAMLYELRRVGDAEPQALWFANLEHAGGWTQMFVSPGGVREFPPLSPQQQWPIEMGAAVTLRDGGAAQFKLTITRASEHEHRRLLEISRDEGRSWRPVLDYTYRRISPALDAPSSAG